MWGLSIFGQENEQVKIKEQMSEENLKYSSELFYPYNLRIKFSTLNLKTRLSGTYGEYLTTLFNIEHLYFQGLNYSLGLLTEFDHDFIDEIDFSVESFSLETEFDYKDLNDVGKTARFEIAGYLLKAGVWYHLNPNNWVGVFAGYGQNTLTRKMHGFQDDNIIASNVDENGQLNTSKNTASNYIMEMSYTYILYQRINLSGQYGYFSSSYEISEEDKSAAKDEKNITIKSNLQLWGYYYLFGIGILI